MEKLISMTDFVLERNQPMQNGLVRRINSEYNKIIHYANFLKQPLTLGMFVPCDFDCNVLDEPPIFKEWIKLKYTYPYSEYAKIKCKEYQEAKDRVLFKGFEFSHDNDYNSVVRQKTDSGIKVEIQFRKYEKDVRIIINSDYIYYCGSVERLIGLDTKPILTESAKKQIF